jgi:heme oxygenase
VSVSDPSEARRAPIDVLAAVRAATAARHARLDHSMPLSGAGADRVALAAHLLLLRRWLIGLPWAAADAAAHDPLPAKRRAGLLARLDADLVDLGLSAGSTDATGRERPASAPGLRADAPAFRWGVAYVVEGAQLGGRMLHRRLAQRLSPHPLRSLRGDLGAVDPVWPGFVRDLQHAVPPGPAVAAAVDGAVWAFDALLTQLPAAPLSAAASRRATRAAKESPEAGADARTGVHGAEVAR